MRILVLQKFKKINRIRKKIEFKRDEPCCLYNIKKANTYVYQQVNKKTISRKEFYDKDVSKVCDEFQEMLEQNKLTKIW